VSNSAESYTLMAAANNALRRGDAVAARDHFGQAVAADPSDIEAWLGLAVAFKDLKDRDRALAAIDRALGLAPRSFRALIVRADLYADEGDARSASSFYAAALRCAPPAAQLSPHQLSEVRRAQQMCDHYTRAYESYFQEKLAAKGFDPARSSPRFAHSLDLMMGRKKIFLQQPSQYYFPGLPQIQFYEREAFSWLAAIEQATDDIATELKAILEGPEAFEPYVQNEANRPRRENDSMTDSRDWTAFYLRKSGKVVAANAARCPKTMRALESAPLCSIPGRAPSILFSQLCAGARIPPHTGFVNTRLICHLPLIVPDGCGFRVGSETRVWEKGKALVFDDTIEHEAWNTSRETGIILLFEIWRPELSGEERKLVSALIEATDSYGGKRVEWTS
jgi:aspartyl/asparaginyl beta-hydroxylase (cupin superfamily)